MNGDAFNVLQSPVGGALSGVLERAISLVAADPLNGCGDFVNFAEVAGKVGNAQLWPTSMFVP